MLLRAILVVALATGCRVPAARSPAGPFTIVLGIAQDGGAPQPGCRRSCCAARLTDPSRRLHVASLGIVDPVSGRRFLVDATPDLGAQLAMLDRCAPASASPGLDGILLTHAHAGHYLGLAFLGRETMGAHGVPVHAMPRMEKFLRGNGPWSQLVDLGNVEIRPLADGRAVVLADGIEVLPIQVSHRDEWSETVGFLVRGPGRSVAWIPDVDRWSEGDRWLEALLARVDVAYLDGTFHDGSELPGRDLATIPHPFVADTVRRLSSLPAADRAKVRFVHLNHTNPILREDSPERVALESAGFAVAREGEVVPLATGDLRPLPR